MVEVASVFNTFESIVQSACAWKAAVRMQRTNERMGPNHVFNTPVNVFEILEVLFGAASC